MDFFISKLDIFVFIIIISIEIKNFLILKILIEKVYIISFTPEIDHLGFI